MKKDSISQTTEFLKKIFHFLKPPPEWLLAVIIILGAFAGLVIYIAHISNATSYLSDDPMTCINCHVMVPQYATWRRSSHARVATCTDCHVPHDNIFHKYQFKMKDGIRHATIFTMKQEPQVIRIKPEGAAAVQENCIRCHTDVLQDVSIHSTSYEDSLEGKGKLCWECHREVPHGRVRSLAATPFAHVPEDGGMIPQWLKKFFPLIDNTSNEGK